MKLPLHFPPRTGGRSPAQGAGDGSADQLAAKRHLAVELLSKLSPNLAACAGPCSRGTRGAEAHTVSSAGCHLQAESRDAGVLVDRRRLRGDGAEVRRLEDDRLGGALFGRAGIDRQRDRGGRRLLGDYGQPQAGRPRPSVRAPQGRVFLGRAGRRADRHRGTAHHRWRWRATGRRRRSSTSR